jgi:hypothetical protein
MDCSARALAPRRAPRRQEDRIGAVVRVVPRCAVKEPPRPILQGAPRFDHSHQSFSLSPYLLARTYIIESDTNRYRETIFVFVVLFRFKFEYVYLKI